MQEDVEDVHGKAQVLRAQYQEALGLALSLEIRLYPGRPFVLLRVSVTNVGTETIRLRRFFVRTPAGGVVSTEPPIGFYANGWQSWSWAGTLQPGTAGPRFDRVTRALMGPMIQNQLTPWRSKSDRFWSETVGALVTSNEALIGGAVSLGDQFVQMWADLRNGHRRVMLQSQVDDVPLAAGSSRHSEWFYLEWVPLPNADPFAQFAHAVARQMALGPTRAVPTGWTSWYMYGADVTESDIIANLASAALLADEMPLNVIQIDDGYQAAWGDWTLPAAEFAHSPHWLADRIRGSGFVPGLWLAPFVVQKNATLVRDHPDWLLRGERGRPVRAGLVSNFVGRVLDVTHPEVRDYLAELVDTVVNEWGYDYLKLDFVYAAALRGKRHNAHITRAQALRQALALIRNAAGPDTYLLGCGAPLGPSVGLVDAMRIGPDTAPYWAPRIWRLGRWVERNPSLPSLRNSLRNVASRAWMHGRWWVNDPDALLVRGTKSELSEDEVRAQVTLVGLTGGSLVLSDDLDDLSLERRAMAAALFPPLLDGMDVLDLLQSPMPENIVVPVARSWGRWRLIGLFNWQDQPVERELPEMVKLSERKAYHVVDFWERRYFLMGPGALRPVVHIPPHGVVLLGLRAVKPDSHLVATTFHISQGGELKDWRVSPGEVSFRLDLDRGAKGAVWLSLPVRPHQVIRNDEVLPKDVVHAVASGVWSVNCRINGEATLRVLWDASGG
jgi:alpha-galactosidase